MITSRKARRETLLAAALLGSVMGAAGCASTAAQGEPTTPAGEKASCKGEASCNGQHGCGAKGAPGDTAGGATGEKASCKGEASCNGQHGCGAKGAPGEAAGGAAPTEVK